MWLVTGAEEMVNVVGAENALAGIVMVIPLAIWSDTENVPPEAVALKDSAGVRVPVVIVPEFGSGVTGESEVQPDNNKM